MDNRKPIEELDFFNDEALSSEPVSFNPSFFGRPHGFNEDISSGENSSWFPEDPPETTFSIPMDFPAPLGDMSLLAMPVGVLETNNSRTAPIPNTQELKSDFNLHPNMQNLVALTDPSQTQQNPSAPISISNPLKPTNGRLIFPEAPPQSNSEDNGKIKSQRKSAASAEPYPKEKPKPNSAAVKKKPVSKRHTPVHKLNQASKNNSPPIKWKPPTHHAPSFFGSISEDDVIRTLMTVLVNEHNKKYRR